MSSFADWVRLMSMTFGSLIQKQSQTTLYRIFEIIFRLFLIEMSEKKLSPSQTVHMEQVESFLRTESKGI